MSYFEKDGQVILTMSREDHESLLIAFGLATSALLARRDDLQELLALLNRLNEGNPRYSPYSLEVEET